jgi:hypothetical protein
LKLNEYGAYDKTSKQAGGHRTLIDKYHLQWGSFSYLAYGIGNINLDDYTSHTLQAIQNNGLVVA